MSAPLYFVLLLLIGYAGAVLGIVWYYRKARQLAVSSPLKAERLRARGGDSLTVLAAISSLILIPSNFHSAVNYFCPLWEVAGFIALIMGIFSAKRALQRRGLILIILAYIVPSVAYPILEKIAIRLY